MSTQHIVHRIIEPGLPGDGFTAPEAEVVRTSIEAHTSAIARTDPGTAGAVGQTLTIGPSGPAWMDDRVFNVKHPRFGAKGDNTTDDTAAIQAAINAAIGGGVVFLPKGQYKVTGTLVITGFGITIMGTGRFTGTNITKTTSGSLFELNNVSYLNMESIYLSATSGHVFDAKSTITHSRWFDLRIKQWSPSYSIFHLDDTLAGRPLADYIDNIWDRVESLHVLEATVPTFKIRSYACNRNRWVDCRPHFSGNYHYWIESTHSSGARAIGNVFEGLTGEVLNGGAIMILGGMGTRISDFDMWDFSGTITNHLIVLDMSVTNGNKFTTHTVLSNVRRITGTLGSGIRDLYIGDGESGGNNRTTLVNCGGYSEMQVRDRGSIVQIGGDCSYSQGLSVMRLASSGTAYVNNPFGVATYTTAGRPAANTVRAGTMIYDSTLGKPIWSDNVNWRDAAGTIV